LQTGTSDVEIELRIGIIGSGNIAATTERPIPS